MTNSRFIWSLFNWKISVQLPYLLFALFAVALCTGLAHWQWQRAQAADSLFSSYQLQESRPASVLPESPEAYQNVAISGDVVNHFFLDNRIYQGFAGWHVLAEVETNGFNILVNLGWQQKQDKLELQQDLPSHIEVQGLIKKPQRGFMLQGAEQDPNWPQLQQQIDIALLNGHLGYELFPFVLYAESSVSGLIPAPIEMENKFYMHIGYAVQWLLIGIACLIGFIYISRVEQRENEQKK